MYLFTADCDVCFIIVLACDGGVLGQDQVRDVTIFRNNACFIVEGVSVGVLILNSMLLIVWIESCWKFESVESTHNLNLTDDLVL